VIGLKKLQWKTLLPCLAIPLAVGGLSAWLTKDAMAEFARLRQPPLSPPGWAFPIVWSILFLLMGYASYRALTSPAPRPQVRRALVLYGVQLAFNFGWSLIFFLAGAYLFALIWLVALWGLILWTLLLFSRLDRCAGWLLVPYLAWVSFAGYLNFGIWMLN